MVNLFGQIGTSSFKWRDVLYSKTAKDLDTTAGLSPENKNALQYLQYNPPQEVINNMIILIDNVVEPTKQMSGINFTVNSGYRHKTVNSKIKGSSNTSDHILGRAVDIETPGKRQNAELFYWIRDNIVFDQLIWENGNTTRPAWVHVSFRLNNNRNQVFAIGVKNAPTQAGISPIRNTINELPVGGLITENQLAQPFAVYKEVDSEQTEQIDNSKLALDSLFAEFEVALKNQEAGFTESLKWGGKLNPAEKSNWIGLKQYFIYLCTRFSPQSLVPFLELIPKYQLSQSNLSAVQESRIDVDDVIEEMTKVAGQNPPNNIRNQIINALRHLKQPIPGYNETRYNNNVKNTNRLNGKADLFKLDPFQNEFSELGVLSESGQSIFNKKKIGVRLFDQVLLTPEAGTNEINKAGAIGFTEVEIKPGSSASDGLSLISMTIVDVQGNKFTDINSPWSFIFDSRPGTESADFLFRFGWSLRFPNNSLDPTYKKFWEHPGWKLFGGDRIITEIQNQLKGDFRFVLTQSTGLSDIFDGDVFDSSQKISTKGIIEEDELQSRGSYMELSLINPQLSVGEDGSITAQLQFRTADQATRDTLLIQSESTKALCTEYNSFTLADLIIAVHNDFELANALTIHDPAARAKKINTVNTETFQRSETGRDLRNLVTVVGGFDIGRTANSGINPDRIIINLQKKHVNRITSPDNKEKLNKFLSDVLYDNDCVLLAIHMGSGTTVNTPFIITTTQSAAIEPESYISNSAPDSNELIAQLQNDRDVLGFKHEASNIESISIASTDTPNAYTIELNHQVADLLNFDSGSYTERSPASVLNKKVNIIRLFSQLLCANATTMGMPWLTPGLYFYVKGMGFNDGIYTCMECTHKFHNDGKFTTEIVGNRVIYPLDEQQDQAVVENISSQNTNLTQPVVVESLFLNSILTP